VAVVKRREGGPLILKGKNLGGWADLDNLKFDKGRPVDLCGYGCGGEEN